MRHSECSDKQLLTSGTNLATINLRCIDCSGSVDQYQSSRGSTDRCLIQIKKIEGSCLWHSLCAVLLFLAHPSAKGREGERRKVRKDLER